MKRGSPNGATASSRADAGAARPAESRPRVLFAPTDPLTAISAVKVRMPRQARVACARRSTASGAGEPGPDGSFRSGAAHEADTIATTATSARARPIDGRAVIFFRASVTQIESTFRYVSTGPICL